MNYAFLIDNRKCIGCHACTTACKSENQVPLGVNRTWVKYVEKGLFPNARRHFQVTRCNHCANPPCVRICPVTAMYQRADGIVEFDPRVCIGCKACMQACPYDAIYIDPETHTAAKCHYCSHRTELGLEPACVVVCPEHAIVSGDLDDADSEISRLIAREEVSVRKPEQGTAPKLFYIEGEQVALTPTAARMYTTFAFAEVVAEQRISESANHQSSKSGSLSTQYALRSTHYAVHNTQYAKSGVAIRVPGAQSVGYGGGPIMIGEGRMAGHIVQTAYNAQHQAPWHWPVPAYLVTKGIGSGVFMLMAIIFGLGIAPFSRSLALLGDFLSLVFIGLTTLLLVVDLDRPERFFTILTRPQWKSWLTRGAFILVGFSALAGLWFLLEGAAGLNLLPASLADALRPVFLALGSLLAAGAAIYTGFLFGQAEGRDLWQSTLSPVHLLLQALMVGSGALLAASVFAAAPPGMAPALMWVFGVSLAADLLASLVGEFGMPHASETAARAAHEIVKGKYRLHFWGGAVGLGHLLPLALLLAGQPQAGQPQAGQPQGLPLPVAVLAALAASAGLYFYEYAFVMAPQEVPNS
jgi:Fe-S-cluster-containing dehydrogenase component/formate-dependent nitrite reductase membrane component NrfD